MQTVAPQAPPSSSTTRLPTRPPGQRRLIHILYLSNGKLSLIDRATKADRASHQSTSPTTQAKPQQKLLIHAARFWKGSGSHEQTDVDILITDNRITSVTPHGATPPAGVTRTIEAGDSTVLPGLWENHAHTDSDNGIYYGDRLGRLWLVYGVTELRAIADNAYRALEHTRVVRRRRSHRTHVSSPPAKPSTASASTTR